MPEGKSGGKRYTLTVTVTKTEQPVPMPKQHSIVAESYNLTLEEATAMQAPLADVMKAHIAADAE